MKLMVGLGNPGTEYENTRHNIGFLFVEELARKWNASGFELEKKVNSKITEIHYKLKAISYKLILAKPQTFMNKSGRAVTALAKFYKIKPKDIWIVHDDIDILWGKFRISFGRSSAGHRGVESIIRALRTKDFWRARIGIQPKLIINNKRQATRTKADKIILKKFTPQESKTLTQIIKSAISDLEMALKNS